MVNKKNHEHNLDLLASRIILFFSIIILTLNAVYFFKFNQNLINQQFFLGICLLIYGLHLSETTQKKI